MKLELTTTGIEETTSRGKITRAMLLEAFDLPADAVITVTSPYSGQDLEIDGDVKGLNVVITKTRRF